MLIECVQGGSKVRTRVVSPGYDHDRNVPFPKLSRPDKAILESGKRFVVDLVVDPGSYYGVRGNITEERRGAEDSNKSEVSYEGGCSTKSGCCSRVQALRR